jgi:uncharacterized MnhB-related membrane protein
MNFDKHTIIKFILFVFFLAALVALFLIIQNSTGSSIEKPIHPAIHFGVFGLLISVGFGLFLSSLFVQKTIVQQQEIIKTDQESDNNVKDDSEKQVKIQYDVDKLLNEITPKSQKDETLEFYTEKLISNLSKKFDVVQAIMFIKNKKEQIFEYCSDYAFYAEDKPKSFKEGETLPGQVVKNKKPINITDIPDNYIKIVSGLGESSPNHLLIIPVITKNEVIGIIELASFKVLSSEAIDAINQTVKKLAETINKLIKT